MMVIRVPRLPKENRYKHLLYGNYISFYLRTLGMLKGLRHDDDDVRVCHAVEHFHSKLDDGDCCVKQ